MNVLQQRLLQHCWKRSPIACAAVPAAAVLQLWPRHVCPSLSSSNPISQLTCRCAQAWRCRAACWWLRRSGAALGWPPLPPALCTACRCGGAMHRLGGLPPASFVAGRRLPLLLSAVATVTPLPGFLLLLLLRQPQPAIEHRLYASPPLPTCSLTPCL